MARARLDVDALAETSGVDPKTVQRWLAGRVPYPRHRWTVATSLGVEEDDLWPQASQVASHDVRLRRLWEANQADSTEAVREIQRSLGFTLSGQLVNIEHRATILITSDGSADIEQAFVSANASYGPIMALTRDMWFEHPQVDVGLKGASQRPIPLRLHFVRDFPNYKQFVCDFVKPIQPLEVVKFSYRYHADRMFLSDHFWDQRVLAPTIDLSVSITHDKGSALTACMITEEFQDGPLRDPDPNVSMAHDGDGRCVIRWQKDFPRVNGLYRIQWSFDA